MDNNHTNKTIHPTNKTIHHDNKFVHHDNKFVLHDKNHDNKSFKSVFSDLILNDNNLSLFFGKIVHKVTEHAFSLNILNPIILSRLPSLYKFRVKNKEILTKSVSSSYTPDLVEPVSINYIYLPSKIYDVMIYQYKGDKRQETRLKMGKNKECVLEVHEKNVERLMEYIMGLCDDIHYKYNKIYI
ncbi:mRNA-capping enzyme subunit beta-like protein [Vairimorpha necatrix]|uniref:mRNA-capping enzyme subunit beta-like protein n=1 Tax=Vairimorpha necatrix TaxID=6039 RepID=A0AAX4JGB7_9MICR